jgi:cytochrome bd ubiquinol oxidase subunit I
MDFPYYPLHDFGPIMKGLVIGSLGILHVFLAQFAIGGGMLMCYFQWLAQSGRDPHGLARDLLNSYFKFLVLLSFVLGAVTGVGLWFTTIQISPRTIGVMVDEFHWLWATEWTFFCLEVAAGYTFYRYGAQLPDPIRMRLLVLYSLAAWMSLFWINGILSWQLTPGQWLESPGVWQGFFNPSFFPSLIFRTVACLTIASLVGCIVINTMRGLDVLERTWLINRAARLLWPIVLMPLLGVWFLAVIPDDSRSYALGGSAAMSLFLAVTIGSSALIGGYALIGMIRQKLYINGATATLLTALAFGATAGGEFVREGLRKPFTIRESLYSNSISPDEIERLRQIGSVTHDPFPLLRSESYPNDQVRLGAKVYRLQCSVCHTINGVNGLTHLAGSWTSGMKRQNLSKLQRLKPFMPPFAGTPDELEALVHFIGWQSAGRLSEWPDSSQADDYSRQLEQIQAWLDEAGTKPGYLPLTTSAVSWIPEGPEEESPPLP